MPKKTAKKKPGPVPLADHLKSRMASTKLAPDVWEWVRTQGGGSVTRGLRLVVIAHREMTTRNNSANS